MNKRYPPEVQGVLDKLGEEVAELQSADAAETQEHELGDLLFTVVNLARWLGIDAEGALRGACDRFAQRYAEMEREAHAQGIDLADLPLTEQDALWDRAKTHG